MEHQGFIFTTHAQERLKLRSVSPDDVVKVLRHPTHTFPGDKANTTKFIRTLNQREIQVIATYLKDQKKWLIVSVWVRGEDDPESWSWWMVALPFRILWWLVKKCI
ncbi:MAG TPA: DUF4258 domain-containing protein [Vitreimonas sp.]|nr:DUF4258 domain-containing protein [Vitreimonas sp.]